jgi:hypothetical protein
MFELADRLVGIYKAYDCTNSVTMDNLDKIEEKKQKEAKKHQPRSSQPDSVIPVQSLLSAEAIAAALSEASGEVESPDLDRSKEQPEQPEAEVEEKQMEVDGDGDLFDQVKNAPENPVA